MKEYLRNLYSIKLEKIKYKDQFLDSFKPHFHTKKSIA